MVLMLMRYRTAVLCATVLCTAALYLVGACASSDPPPTAPGLAASAGGERHADCTPMGNREEAIAAYAEGRRLLKESRRGEHFDAAGLQAALERLRVAASAGMRDAQALFGTTAFSVLFMRDAPTEAQREEYIEALVFLRLAALGGAEEAAAFLPGIGGAEPPSAEEPPLDAIPAAWLSQAWERADRWLACHASPWASSP